MGKIFKVQLENQYTQVPNTTVKAVEKEISLQALGLLVNIMSYAETWELHKTELYKRYAKNKKTSVMSAWDELVKASYIIECRIRVGKKWDYHYFVRLQPFAELEKEEIKKQVEAQTTDKNSIFWASGFEKPKMGSSKPAPNKERTKEKIIKEIQTVSKYVDSPAIQLFFENYEPNKAEQKSLIDLFDTHGEELCHEAIQRTFNKGKKVDNTMGYIKGTLENWAKLGLKTVEGIKAFEESYWHAKEQQRKAGKQKSANKQQANGKEPAKLPKAIANEIVEPDYTDEELEDMYVDIGATLKFLRSTEDNILKQRA